jgi:hypothetical protein
VNNTLMCKGEVKPFPNDSISLEKPSHCSPGFVVVRFSSRVLLSTLGSDAS